MAADWSSESVVLCLTPYGTFLLELLHLRVFWLEPLFLAFGAPFLQARPEL